MCVDVGVSVVFPSLGKYSTFPRRWRRFSLLSCVAGVLSQSPPPNDSRERLERKQNHLMPLNSQQHPKKGERERGAYCLPHRVAWLGALEKVDK